MFKVVQKVIGVFKKMNKIENLSSRYLPPK